MGLGQSDFERLDTVLLKHARDAFTDQVVEKKIADALGTLSHLLEEGTPILVLTGMLARHLRMLVKTKDALKGRARAASES